MHLWGHVSATIFQRNRWFGRPRTDRRANAFYRCGGGICERTACQNEGYTPMMLRIVLLM